MEGLIGKDLGRYHILEHIGEGSMATVYKAYDNRLEQCVAIKTIRQSSQIFSDQPEEIPEDRR